MPNSVWKSQVKTLYVWLGVKPNICSHKSETGGQNYTHRNLPHGIERPMFLLVVFDFDFALQFTASSKFDYK